MIASNYPYDTDLAKGWLHLDEIKKEDKHIEFKEEDDGLFEDIDLYPENTHDEGYVGWNGTIGAYTLYVGHSLEQIKEAKSIVAKIAIWIFPISLLLIFLVCLIFNRMTTRRIKIINEHCGSIRTQGDLSYSGFSTI